MSLPEASSKMAAVMTLKVTKTKNKVVIVHLKEEGRGSLKHGDMEEGQVT